MCINKKKYKKSWLHGFLFCGHVLELGFYDSGFRGVV